MKNQIIEWEIISQCNYNCEYCELPNFSYEKNEDILQKFILNFKQFNSEIFCFGGEPFLHPKIKFIIKTFNDNNIPFVIQSNASTKSINIIIQNNLKNFNMNISIHPSEISINQVIINLLKIQHLHINTIDVMYIGKQSIQYYKKLSKIFNNVQIIPISGFYETNSCKLTAEYNKIKKKYSNISFEDIIVSEFNKQRSVVWEDQCNCKIITKGKICAYKNYKLYDSLLRSYNCCYRKNTNGICENEKCFWM